MSHLVHGTHRRGFLGGIAAGAATLVLGRWSTANAEIAAIADSSVLNDEWVSRIKGKHKQVFDCATPNSGFAAAYAVNFEDTTKEATKASDKDITPVLVFRHLAMPLTLNDAMWAKYKIGEFLDVKDPATNAHATRNIFRDNIPGHPGLTYEKLTSDRHVVVVGCNLALTILSGMLGGKVGVSADQAKKDWNENLLSGVNLAASGVYAVNRAQQAGCSYCYAG